MCPPRPGSTTARDATIKSRGCNVLYYNRSCSSGVSPAASAPQGRVGRDRRPRTPRWKTTERGIRLGRARGSNALLVWSNAEDQSRRFLTLENLTIFPLCGGTARRNKMSDMFGNWKRACPLRNSLICLVLSVCWVWAACLVWAVCRVPSPFGRRWRCRFCRWTGRVCGALARRRTNHPNSKCIYTYKAALGRYDFEGNGWWWDKNTSGLGSTTMLRHRAPVACFSGMLHYETDSRTIKHI